MTALSAVLEQTAHRPWPLSSAPWLMFMRWTDLAFLHWKVRVESLLKHLPSGLTLDTYEGDAWLGIVPFRMENVHFRGLPPIPTTATFLEINVRTYVHAGGRAGVWFLSLDASSRLAVHGARVGLNLPYFLADMQIRNRNSTVEYESRRTDRSGPPATFRALYQPVEKAHPALPGSLEHWLTERYCLFGHSRSKRLYSLDIHHVLWPLERATVQTERNTMTAALDLSLADAEPLVHFAHRQDVVAWGRKWL